MTQNKKLIYSDLAEEVKKRKVQQEDIRKRIDDYAQQRFGIAKLSGKINDYLGVSHKLRVCLCRQVVTPNIEHVATVVLATWLTNMGLPAEASFMSLKRDSFSPDNKYKKSLTKLSRIKKSRRRKDLLYPDNKKIVSNKGNKLFGQVFSEIKTIHGFSLTDFHNNLAKQFLPWDYHQVDASEMMADFLHCSLEQKTAMKPAYCYVVEKGLEKKIDLPAKLNGQQIRPGADWLYQIHLLSFLDGQRVLLSQIGDDDKMVKCFSEPIRHIENEIGLRPLIIDTPYQVSVKNHQSNLHEINITLGSKTPSLFIPETEKSETLFSVMEKSEINLLCDC